MSVEDDLRRGNVRMLHLKPHIVIDEAIMRIILCIHEGRWVVACVANREPLVLALLGAAYHPFYQAAVEWTEAANAKLAEQRAAQAIDRLMRL